ncbi:Xaa-Pro peptidase family protein [uncultured Acidaminococcus sp.]|uniref:M24 family metallopeptidase n=1 Tax=uncultured Acidaminococcus sp. TaxID=352152 RepID=UPI00262F4745|nr:Xaa-Pro peptidase family protein [uncultured Acidaminococcus sp.]
MDAAGFVKNRIEKLKEKMAEQGIDAVIIEKPENVMYYSNFNEVLNSMPAFVILTLASEPVLLVHSLRADHARNEGAVSNVKLYGKWGNNVPVAMDPIEAIRILLGSFKGTLGLETEYMNVARYQKIKEIVKPKDILSISNLINMQKIIKDQYEIQCIKKSAELVDLGVKTTIEYLSQGYSEAEASTEGQYAMRKLWHKKFRDSEVCGYGTSEGGMIDSLHVWCLSGGHIAYGCDCPKHYYPKEGDLTLPMAWAKTDGYHAENERTIIIGHLDGFKQHAYDSMLRARKAVFKILKPGTLFKDLYFAAAKVYSDAGFEKILPGRVGHGVGCSAHEFPSLDPKNEIPLAPGMVITVEPGLMDKSWGGVRHSDTVLITESGYERLTVLENGKIVVNLK